MDQEVINLMEDEFQTKLEISQKVIIDAVKSELGLIPDLDRRVKALEEENTELKAKVDTLENENRDMKTKLKYVKSKLKTHSGALRKVETESTNLLNKMDEATKITAGGSSRSPRSPSPPMRSMSASPGPSAKRSSSCMSIGSESGSNSDAADVPDSFQPAKTSTPSHKSRSSHRMEAKRMKIPIVLNDVPSDSLKRDLEPFYCETQPGDYFSQAQAAYFNMKIFGGKEKFRPTTSAVQEFIQRGVVDGMWPHENWCPAKAETSFEDFLKNRVKNISKRYYATQVSGTVAALMRATSQVSGTAGKK